MIRTGDFAAVIKGREKGRVTKITGNLAYLDVDGFEIPFQINELVRLPEQGMNSDVSENTSKPVFEGRIDFHLLKLSEASLAFRKLENEGRKSFQLYIFNPTPFTLRCRVFEEKNNHWNLIFEDVVKDRNYFEGPRFPEADLGRLNHLFIQYLFTPVRVYETCPLPVQEVHTGVGKRLVKEGTFKDNNGMKFFVLKGLGEFHRELISSAEVKTDDLPRPAKPVVERGMTTEEIDLHIEELLEDISGMSNHEMLQTQLNACKRKIEQCLMNGTHKLIVIHGVGKGRLKEEVIVLLKDYEKLRWEPAPAQQYGRGAMTIYFV